MTLDEYYALKVNDIILHMRSGLTYTIDSPIGGCVRLKDIPGPVPRSVLLNGFAIEREIMYDDDSII